MVIDLRFKFELFTLKYTIMEKKTFVFWVIIAAALTIFICDNIMAEYEMTDRKVHEDEAYIYETTPDIQVIYGEIPVIEDFYIPVCKYQLDEDVYLELDVEYKNLKAETPYDYYEKNGISFVISEKDTVRLGEINF